MFVEKSETILNERCFNGKAKNYFREITAANMARLSNMSQTKSSGERYFNKSLLKN